MTDDDHRLCVLRGIGRHSYSVYRDHGKAAYDMVKVAREDNVPDDIVKQAFSDLRNEGIFSDA